MTAREPLLAIAFPALGLLALGLLALGPLALGLLALGCAGPAEEPAAEPAAEAGAITLRDAWARVLPGVGAIYLTIVNDGGEADRLVAVETPAAAVAMLHATVDVGETVKMVGHESGFEIGPGATLELAPGGRHVMLMEPAEGVADGDTIVVKLRFERAGALELDVPVRGAAD